MKLQRVVGVLLCALCIGITGSALIGGLLGVTAAEAARILYAIYKAYKSGKSIKAAVGAVTGGSGFVVWLIVDAILGVGINLIMGSSWLQSF